MTKQQAEEFLPEIGSSKTHGQLRDHVLATIEALNQARHERCEALSIADAEREARTLRTLLQILSALEEMAERQNTSAQAGFVEYEREQLERIINRIAQMRQENIDPPDH